MSVRQADQRRRPDWATVQRLLDFIALDFEEAIARLDPRLSDRMRRSWDADVVLLRLISDLVQPDRVRESAAPDRPTRLYLAPGEDQVRVPMLLDAIDKAAADVGSALELLGHEAHRS